MQGFTSVSFRQGFTRASSRHRLDEFYKEASWFPLISLKKWVSCNVNKAAHNQTSMSVPVFRLFNLMKGVCMYFEKKNQKI